MRLLPTAALIVGLFVPSGARVEAQSLADAAAREKEKRKAQKPSKVFTEDDLRRAGSSGRASVITGEAAGDATGDASAEAVPPAEGTEGAPPSEETGSTKKPEKTSAEVRAEKQKDWRARLDKVQGELAAATAEVSRIQTAMQGLSPESTSAIANFTTRLTEQQKRAADARQQIEVLETEGRFNGFR